MNVNDASQMSDELGQSRVALFKSWLTTQRVVTRYHFVRSMYPEARYRWAIRSAGTIASVNEIAVRKQGYPWCASRG